jgi:magnesium transporter
LKHTQLHFERIHDALIEGDYEFIRQAFKDINEADIAEFAQNFEASEIAQIFRCVDGDRKPELFAYLPFELQEDLLDDLPEMVVTSILNEMEPVDRTQFLEDLNFVIRDRLIRKMTPEERSIALQLLAYPEDSIGRLMSPEFLSLKPEMAGHQALEHIRWFVDYSEVAIHNMFVMDEYGKYLGDISLSAIVMSPSQKISEMMTPSLNGLNPHDDKETAVDHFRKYEQTFAPVVNESGVVIGIVTADDVLDVAEEEATEDLQQFGATGVFEDSYFGTTLLELFRKRGSWLAVLFVGELFAVAAMQRYEEVIASVGFLIYFVPLIISSGGNSGTQAASLIIRGLAIKEMTPADWLKVFRREIIMGLSLGFILASFGAICSVIWGQPQHVSLIVFVSLIGVVTFGATVGSMLPFVLDRLGFDPAVSSSPFIACIVDFAGILIYFGFATYVLTQVGVL